MAIEELKLTEASTPCVFFFEIRNALIVGERRGRSTPQKSADFPRDLENCRCGLFHCRATMP